MWIAIVTLIVILAVGSHHAAHQRNQLVNKNRALQAQVHQLQHNPIPQVNTLNGVQITNLDK